ncbi:MAG: HNH endonuclease [Elusimicrobia bacterium]|nr:HNH endonuclease [Elusimicrobiota bacterium]
MDVLVLNRNFFAIQITTWRRALRLVYMDRASVVDEEYKTYSFGDWCEISRYIKAHPGGFVKTPALRIAIPEVIALKFYDRVPFRDVKFTRRNIYEHYNYKCCYCGKKLPPTQLNLDHVVPRSRGGRTDWKNVVTSCISCNLKKGSFLLEEAGMKLKIKPNRPAVNPCLSLILKSPAKVKSSWQKFIDSVYWNIELEKE